MNCIQLDVCLAVLTLSSGMPGILDQLNAFGVVTPENCLGALRPLSHHR
jgi:hypothetical protein